MCIDLCLERSYSNNYVEYKFVCIGSWRLGCHVIIVYTYIHIKCATPNYDFKLCICMKSNYCKNTHLLSSSVMKMRAMSLARTPPDTGDSNAMKDSSSSNTRSLVISMATVLSLWPAKNVTVLLMAV